MAEQPNDASRKDKAEGERWSDEPNAEPAVDQSTRSAPGLAGGQSRPDRGPLDTPRRYDQPIEDDDDPVMPSDDTTVNTKI
jgi:hypothetical protein